MLLDEKKNNGYLQHLLKGSKLSKSYFKHTVCFFYQYGFAELGILVFSAANGNLKFFQLQASNPKLIGFNDG